MRRQDGNASRGRRNDVQSLVLGKNGEMEPHRCICQGQEQDSSWSKEVRRVVGNGCVSPGKCKEMAAACGSQALRGSEGAGKGRVNVEVHVEYTKKSEEDSTAPWSA